MVRARTIVGFAVAPLVPVSLITLALLAAGAREDAQELVLVGIVLGYVIALLFGLPLFVALRRFGQNSLMSYVATGALLGAFLYAAVPAMIDALMRLQGVDGGHTYFSLSVPPVAVTLASAAAISFWLIVRPDRAAS